MTTKELINQYLDGLIDLEMHESGEYPLSHYDLIAAQAKVDNAKAAISNKINNIDDFIVNIEKDIVSVNSQVDFFKKEIELAKKAINRMENLKSFLLNDLIGMAINNLGDGKRWENNGRKYTRVVRPGKLIIETEEFIPEDLINVEVVRTINKKDLRNHIIKGNEIEGVLVEDSVSIRRS